MTGAVQCKPAQTAYFFFIDHIFESDFDYLKPIKGTVTATQDSKYDDHAYNLEGQHVTATLLYGTIFSCLIFFIIVFIFMVKRMMIQRRYLLAHNSLANTADFAVVGFGQQNNPLQNKNINDKPPSYETVTEQDKMLPKYEEV